jgi:hypothetical protein
MIIELCLKGGIFRGQRLNEAEINGVTLIYRYQANDPKNVVEYQDMHTDGRRDSSQKARIGYDKPSGGFGRKYCGRLTVSANMALKPDLHNNTNENSFRSLFDTGWTWVNHRRGRGRELSGSRQCQSASSSARKTFFF